MEREGGRSGVSGRAGERQAPWRGWVQPGMGRVAAACASGSRLRGRARFACAAALVGALLGGASPAAAQVQIMSVSATGRGCPGGSYEVLAIGGEVSVLFGSYAAATSGPRAMATIGCDLTLNLRLEPGL